MREKEIRDYLANNLHVISGELTLVKTEYRLENIAGTDGYIDILAKDLYDNYVIIELKRSKQSSRQAIHELIKYLALLKSKLRLKDSEIRMILVAADWSELIVPFCEWKGKVDSLVEGYLFTEDYQCVLIDAQMEEQEQRELSRNQLIFLYQTEKNMEYHKEPLIEKVRACGLKDFILLELRNEGNPAVIYPFALVLIIHRCKEEYYISVLRSKGWNEHQLFLYGYSGEEFLIYLEECIYKELVEEKMYDDLEISYPEKLNFALTQQGWIINNIIKCGYFKEEQRGDNWFIRKIMGVEEDNNFIFTDFCDTKFKKKFQEMLARARVFLESKDDMSYYFDKILFSISQETVKSLNIDIYNRGDILLNLMLFERNIDMGELPFMDMIIEYKQGNIERYILLPAYNEQELKPDHYILKSLKMGDGTIYMINLHSGEIVLHNAQIMKNLGLTYDWLKYSYDGEDWRLVRGFVKKDFSAFYRNHKEDIKKMSEWLISHVSYSKEVYYG